MQIGGREINPTNVTTSDLFFYFTGGRNFVRVDPSLRVPPEPHISNSVAYLRDGYGSVPTQFLLHLARNAPKDVPVEPDVIPGSKTFTPAYQRVMANPSPGSFCSR